MTIDKDKLRGVLAKLASLPEGSDIPDEILAELNHDEILAIYIEQMLMEKNVERTDEVRQKLFDEVSNEIMNNIVNAMPDYLVKQINESLESGADDDVINKAIDESGVDVVTITEQTMTAFREKYLNGEEK